MEGFEHVVKVALESEDFIVDGNQKFFVRRRTKKEKYKEYQTHGYEVDLVGARQDRLVLASVKSFFGSGGVGRQGFRGLADTSKRTNFKKYILFNEKDVRQGMIQEAAKKYGYKINQIEFRLYAGKFASSSAKLEVTQHLHRIRAGAGPIRVIDLDEILDQILRMESKTYVDDPVVAFLKALKQAKRLR